MNSQIAWFVLLLAGIAAVVVTAQTGRTDLHLGAAALVAAIYTIRGLMLHRANEAAGASRSLHDTGRRSLQDTGRRSLQASSNASSMALVWLWGGLSCAIIYASFLTWREWWQFALAFTAVGAISYGFAHLMAKDAAAGKDDATMLKLARNLAWLQLVGMIVTMAGLMIDPDKRFLSVKEGWEDWAANSIFFCGAAALFVLSLHALIKDRRA